MSIADLERSVKQLKAQGRVFSAYRLLQGEVGQSTGPARLWILYSLSVIARSSLGFGIEARDWLEQLAVDDVTEIAKQPQAVIDLRTNALENSMLLSISFEEYMAKAETVRKLRPDSAILMGQAAKFHRERELGRPWSVMMASIAQSYYNDGDRANDKRMYGEAVSTYQVMLANRKALRLDRATWGDVVERYGVLCLRLGSLSFPKGTIHGGPRGADDPTAIVAASTRFIEEFAQANPKHAQGQQILEWQQVWFKSVRESAYVADPGDESVSAVSQVRTTMFTLVSAVKAITASVVVFLVARSLFSEVSLTMSVLAAVAVGLITMVVSIGGSTLSASGDNELKRRLYEAHELRRKGPDGKPVPVKCRNDHVMQGALDEGTLIAKCPTCGAVKPYPGTMSSFQDLERLQQKYGDSFEMM